MISETLNDACGRSVSEMENGSLRIGLPLMLR
jgi:hypothetical protein